MGKASWTIDEENKLCKLYRDGVPIADISREVGHSPSGVVYKVQQLGLTNNHIRKNDINYKAVYQNYDWCFEHYIEKGMCYEDMAEIANTTPRTIQKWCSEKHGINAKTYSSLKRLTYKQKMLIMAGVLGDGHICVRENEPMYIESHADNQKDYLFWKYEILEDVCKHFPTHYDSKVRHMNGKDYLCQPYYKFNTRILDDIDNIRSMSKSSIIKSLDNFGMSLFFLDDAYRSKTNWIICVASFTDEEKRLFIEVCGEKFSLVGKSLKDTDYISFTSDSSRKIDSMILEVIPNDLDIVKDKIISKNRGDNEIQ